MAKKCNCEEGLAEWIMSYADMITILMAFFVVMYSMAGDQKDNQKTEAVMGSLRQWLGPNREPWPMTVGNRGKRVHTPFDTPADAERHRAATQNQKATVPQPHSTFPDGATLFMRASSNKLSEANKEQLAAILETVAGKMNVIEVRGQAKRHLIRRTVSGNPTDLVYNKCRLVMEYLIARGIKPERIQVRIIRSEHEDEDTELALLQRDIQLDVFMLSELLDYQPGVAPRKRTEPQDKAGSH